MKRHDARPLSFRLALWLGAGLLGAAVAVLACLPAAWPAAWATARLQGRMTICDAQGTLWNGSAVLAGAGDAQGGAAPAALLPGRFSWRLSPLALLGVIELRLANPAALPQGLYLHGGWRRWQLERAALALPARQLAALGAPFNTLQAEGDVTLHWDDLALSLQDGALDIQGSMRLDLLAMSSRLSAVKPLGSYRMHWTWRGRRAEAVLATLEGALQLAGSGMLDDGRLRFAGTAQAADGREASLETLLNLLGQRQPTNGKTIIRIGTT